MTVHPKDQINHLDDYPYKDMNGYGRWGMCQFHIFINGVGQYLNPSQVLKKILQLIPNSFIKIEPRPIRGRAGRLLEKTCPITIPK